MSRGFHTPYEGEHNQYIAYPLGGIGAGMMCLEGTGALSHVSFYHKPALYHEPMVMAALTVKTPEGNQALVLEGQVPDRKIYRVPGGGSGLTGKTYGLPRFGTCGFSSRFPFGTVSLRDANFPLAAAVTGWSPFIPGNAHDSSLPVAALEYTIHNPGDEAAEGLFSFHVSTGMAAPEDNKGKSLIKRVPKGFVIEHLPEGCATEEHGWLGVQTDEPDAMVNCRWFRGGWFDSLTMLWNHIESGESVDSDPYEEGAPSPGCSISVALKLAPKQSRCIRIMLHWYVPASALSTVEPPEECACCDPDACCPPDDNAYTPWYASRFDGIGDIMGYFARNHDVLRAETQRFTDCFYASTLPDEVMEAVSANLSILKSPTMLREKGGRLWCWEGCHDTSGCCAGSCTHVWNYGQAVAHLFPDLERSLREGEFCFSQDEAGHQNFRAGLPLRDYPHGFHAAADGQLGGILKVWRDWRISADTQWLRSLWPKVQQSLAYCIRQWDPDGTGVLTEPHHNTYDIEFWGPDGMCSSFYIGALRAAAQMAAALGEDGSAYERLAAKGRAYMEEKLFNGAYFIQEVRTEHKQAMGTSGVDMTDVQSSEAQALFDAEGPKYQYGQGCLSDGVLGAWMEHVCGMDKASISEEKVKAHLASVYRHNLRKDLTGHANPQRPGFALGREGGLLLCTWPMGGKPSLPFVYSDEVWTGIEYQVASHLMLMGFVEEGLDIVRTCRSRYDGRKRNPFDEYECGHWYARALASYALLQAFGGATYDAVEQRLTLKPAIKGDYACFLSTATGYGLVGIKKGEPFLDVASGSILVREWVYAL
ncbi:MAG: non-lysosomal glucosylceramidase [Clostridia bacterium]|nr:non-lysosomal glucosylceramidase [Clostridia bacterium]